MSASRTAVTLATATATNTSTRQTQPMPRRRAASAAPPPLPHVPPTATTTTTNTAVTTTQLASGFRPTKSRSTLTKRSDGLYNEPYSAIVDPEDEVSVLCVQCTPHRRVLVRHMPEREWQRIVRRGAAVHPGQEGESSLHVVGPPEMSTLPRSYRAEAPPSTQESNTNAAVAAPRTAGTATTTTITAAANTMPVEPVVFDYFVAPESRVGKVYARNKSSAFTSLRLQSRYNKSELQRVAREDCRAMLAVERRNIFLRQYQRDMQCRLSGTSLYTMAKELPERFVQTFFMMVENAQAISRHEARMDAIRAGAHGLTAQQQQQYINVQAGREGGSGRSRRRRPGRYLFTLDQASLGCGERLPFAGQAPADGYVVVTVASTADAFTPAWHNWSTTRRFAWMGDEEDEEDDKPYVPVEYGSAAYLPRPHKETPTTTTTATITAKKDKLAVKEVIIRMAEDAAAPPSVVLVEANTKGEEQKADAPVWGEVRCSSPLPPRFPDRTTSKKGSGLSASASTPPGLSPSTSNTSTPLLAAHKGAHQNARAKFIPRNNLSGLEDATLATRTPSPQRLPLSSDDVEDEHSAEVADLPPRRAVSAV